MSIKTAKQVYNELYVIGTAIENFALENHEQLSDVQLCDCSKAIRKLDMVISEAYRKEDMEQNPDSICMRNMDHRGLTAILRARMKLYQERTGNKDNGGFPFLLIDGNTVANTKTEADMKYVKTNLLKQMKTPQDIINECLTNGETDGEIHQGLPRR